MLTKSILAFAIASATPLALAGHERGNTADYGRPESGAAWFLGNNKTVEYCIEIHQAAGIDDKQAEQAISEAISQWRGYAESRNVHSDLEPHLQITFTFRRSSCADDTDLRFLFGHPKDSDPIAAVLEHQEHWNPIGLAHRETFSLYQGWSKGFIWVAAQGSIFSGREFPQWRVSNALKGVLLHELGHVFGVGHVSDTIMDPQRLHIELVAATFRSGPEQQEAIQRLGRIDGSRHLYSVEFTDLDIPGKMYEASIYRPRALEVFADIMGRPATGSPFVKLIRRNFEYSLEMGDQDGTKLIPLRRLVQDGGYDPVFFDSTEVFKIYGPTMVGGASLMSTSLHASGHTTVATLQTASGETAPVLIKRSMDSKPWQVNYIRNGVVRALFYSYE